MEVLTAFARENSLKRVAASMGGAESVPALAPDIQAILTVLGRRELSHEQPDKHLFLHGARLCHSFLGNCNLSGAFLLGADLCGSVMATVNLSSAVLVHANLTKANLYTCDLNSALTTYANLSGAKLIDTKLRKADLSNSNLTGAVFDRVDLRGADLTGAEGLTREQLASAKTDDKTKLPEYVQPAEPPKPVATS